LTDLITTHTYADFDALASMVAARKLYPGAILVLPGSQERAVREFMSLSADIVKIEHEKDARLDDVERLIVVETRSPARIGRMAVLADRKGVEVHVYDHHPRSQGDIRADKDVYEKAGATTTIICDIVRKQGLRITPLEATIMALGIYEDTGSLTFPTTTKRDIDTVSFLVSQGADLKLVSSYLKRELTEKELNLLARLIQSTEVHVVNGVHLAIASAIDDEYVDDLSLLAHKIEEAENFNATFILVQTKDKVQFIARSSLPFVDVSKAASFFGGGGHPTAAGAVIKGVGLPEARAKLLGYLRGHIRSDIKAGDLVKGGALVLGIDETVSDAKEKLTASGSEYAVIQGKVTAGIPAGVVSVKDLDRAISRGFGHARLKGYMSGKVYPVGPETSIYAIQDIMQQKSVGCVPVMDGRRFTGLVTRTDLLRTFHGRLFGEPESGSGGFAVDLTPNIKRVLPAKVAELLRFSGRIAEEMGFKAFAVGGFVRDLILGAGNYDLDIVIEGNSIDYAKRLAGELCGVYIYHKRFGTGTVFFPCPKGIAPGRSAGGKCKIDIAMTRTEIYERPAALPTVKFGPIENDLYRRDFTINAMALGLGRKRFGELLDPFNGRKDLKEGRIRALHDLSFVDDPTRIFRAVRFEQRLNFRIEPHTEELIKKAAGLKMVDRTQKQRIRDEMIAILSEEEPLKAVRRLSELNELRFIDKNLRLTKSVVSMFGSAGEALKWYDKSALKRKHVTERWLLYMAALLDGLGLDDVIRICSEFVFRKDDSKKLNRFKADQRKVLGMLSKKGKMRPSEVYDCLKDYPQDLLLMLVAKSRSQTARRRIMAFMEKYSEVRLRLRGEDLKKEGVKPGPHFKDIMEKALYAKLDGKIKTKAEELDFAMEKMRWE